MMAFLRGVTATAATAPQDLPAPEASESIARAIVAWVDASGPGDARTLTPLLAGQRERRVTRLDLFPV
ncbi:hypothetical protein [Nonomuraea turcica]|uniref:hypothetical protein n=1 Tax=Nonomuraea sp. G32 TaxID=3067274 RepID=UPI00273CE38E|nr:hypothetical protein [Nonomuraea sp. G32]MDP4505032.1 hypothetical protein [Nonomuraea sp. G32]